MLECLKIWMLCQLSLLIEYCKTLFLFDFIQKSSKRISVHFPNLADIIHRLYMILKKILVYDLLWP